MLPVIVGGQNVSCFLSFEVLGLKKCVLGLAHAVHLREAGLGRGGLGPLARHGFRARWVGLSQGLRARRVGLSSGFGSEGLSPFARWILRARGAS